MPTKEQERLNDFKNGKANWRKWGTYLSERQWGTVREDYSPNGTAWDYFPHDHARSRAYRWGEDGIAGWSDDQQQLCFAPTFWNGKDPILKERLFGLTSSEGNHGEDVKELYYYLDNTPTHSYAKYLYKYPQAAYPYNDLVQTNRNRSNEEGEYELLDTGIMNAYWDISIEYAKADADTTHILITATNRGNEIAELTVLPTLWFRNGWDFGVSNKPQITQLENTDDFGRLKAIHAELGTYYLSFEKSERVLFTENETNKEGLFGVLNPTPFTKDAFHQAVVNQDFSFIENKQNGTKSAPFYQLEIPAGEQQSIKLVLSNQLPKNNPLTSSFDKLVQQRKSETDEFYKDIFKATNENLLIQRQAMAGLLWNKQLYNYEIARWLDGDPGQPTPPEQRKQGRNSDWRNFHAAHIMSMPDAWEFPWFAAWDLAFQCVALAVIDSDFAKEQLLLICSKQFQRPDGITPAYEWNFSDVNPPVLAWAVLHIFEKEQTQTGKGDIDFLQTAFNELEQNFHWWLEREDRNKNSIFSGGFLGLDNISLFDRSQILPEGIVLEQADATAWMAMYALQMMKIALLLSANNEQAKYSPLAIDYFDHFTAISEAINEFGNGNGLWDAETGFFYDCLKHSNGQSTPLPVKSLVGLIPLLCVCFLENELLKKTPTLQKYIREKLAKNEQLHRCLSVEGIEVDGNVLLSLVHRNKLEIILDTVLDESTFLSKGGIRSLSKEYESLFCPLIEGYAICINYEPGESTTGLFGGNSNWRGPVWFPINYLLVNALREYSKYYETDFKKNFPTGSENQQSLSEIADSLTQRLGSIFQKDVRGNRPVHNQHPFYQQAENEDLILFYEYFHGDTARGCGASHQTGWTALVALLL